MCDAASQYCEEDEGVVVSYQCIKPRALQHDEHRFVRVPRRRSAQLQFLHGRRRRAEK